MSLLLAPSGGAGHNSPLVADRYASTRGDAPAVSFDDLLLSGAAPDGGLYVPETWPRFSEDELARLARLPFPAQVAAVVGLFAGGSRLAPRLDALAEAAYAGFRHPAIAPLVQIGPEDWFLELFHGPTLAFKDFAMQMLAAMVPALLAEEGRGGQGGGVTLLAATSGDTGSAALAAFARAEGVRIAVLHPEGRVSEVQRRQMTTVLAPGALNIAVSGDFDDCQALVKAAYADAGLSRRLRLAAVNSINWARIAVQTAYYVSAALALGGRAERPVSFAVPSGNFGNAYAAWAAKRIGAPVGRILVATNRNDILARFLEDGGMERRSVHPTIAPSMDIQVASNFERLLYELLGRDGAAVKALLQDFARSGRFAVPGEVLARAREDFSGAAVSEEEIRAEIRRLHEAGGPLADPHSAVGLAALACARAAGELPGPVVALGCAHPAKFAPAVEAASGATPPVPPQLQGVMEGEERFTRCPPDYDAFKRLLEEHATRPGAAAA